MPSTLQVSVADISCNRLYKEALERRSRAEVMVKDRDVTQQKSMLSNSVHRMVSRPETIDQRCEKLFLDWKRTPPVSQVEKRDDCHRYHAKPNRSPDPSVIERLHADHHRRLVENEQKRVHRDKLALVELKLSSLHHSARNDPAVTFERLYTDSARRREAVLQKQLVKEKEELASIRSGAKLATKRASTDRFSMLYRDSQRRARDMSNICQLQSIALKEMLTGRLPLAEVVEYVKNNCELL
jgi:hypothetical protein